MTWSDQIVFVTFKNHIHHCVIFSFFRLSYQLNCVPVPVGYITLNAAYVTLYKGIDKFGLCTPYDHNCGRIFVIYHANNDQKSLQVDKSICTEILYTTCNVVVCKDKYIWLKCLQCTIQYITSVVRGRWTFGVDFN